MGYLELKPAPSLASKSISGNSALQNGSAHNVPPGEPGAGKAATVAQHTDSGNSVKDQIPRTKASDGRLERTESLSHVKADQGHPKLKGGSLTNGSDVHSATPSAAAGASKLVENQKQVDEDENMAKVASKNSTESEVLSKSHCCVWISIFLIRSVLLVGLIT